MQLHFVRTGIHHHAKLATGLHFEALHLNSQFRNIQGLMHSAPAQSRLELVHRIIARVAQFHYLEDLLLVFLFELGHLLVALQLRLEALFPFNTGFALEFPAFHGYVGYALGLGEDGLPRVIRALR